MTTRAALVCFGTAFAVILAGCAKDPTDVSKATNDAYHAHDAGPRPPADAMKGPAGGSVGPFAKTGGVPPNMPKAPGAGGPPPGAGGK